MEAAGRKRFCTNFHDPGRVEDLRRWREPPESGPSACKPRQGRRNPMSATKLDGTDKKPDPFSILEKKKFIREIL